MPEGSPLTWSIADLTTAYAARELAPVEVASEALDRIESLDPELHVFLSVAPELTLAQAEKAAAAYRRGERAPLLGVPISVKDAFHVRGMVTTLGSLVHRDQLALADSGVVRRLRRAGAVFAGKTNTAEFGQSATTDNRLGPPTRNPWDVTRTPGGSSGGAAASVAAGLSTAAIGSDGGGSVRIPAAFTGLFGLKPSPGLCPDEDGFRGMTAFVSPGPLSWSVADGRTLTGVLADRTFPRGPLRPGLRVGFCARPEGRPVEEGVAGAVETAMAAMERLGAEVTEIELPIQGWSEIFGVLVLADEHRERGHLLPLAADDLSVYERRSLEAARELEPHTVEAVAARLQEFRQRVARLFDGVDLIATPTVAVTAFPLGQRPAAIDEEPVDSLWGAFPFAAPFNVAGCPAASLPCGFANELPVGLQVVGPAGGESLVLDACEALEEELAVDCSAVRERWSVSLPVPEA